MGKDKELLNKLIFNYKYFYKPNNINLIELTDKHIQAIENMLNRNERLENIKSRCPNYPTSGIKCALKEENTIYKNQLDDAFERGFIHKSKVKMIRDKAEGVQFYGLGDVIDDLNKLLEEDK